MMGGYGSGHGMMDGYGQDNPNFKAEMEALIDQIEDKRRELDPFWTKGFHPDINPLSHEVLALSLDHSRIQYKISLSGFNYWEGFLLMIFRRFLRNL